MPINIIESRCKGCGICIEFCPRKILSLNELEKIQVDNLDSCINCDQCELRCPDFAIFVQKETQ